MRSAFMTMAAGCALSLAHPSYACSVRYFAALPITMSERGPVTTALVNGKPVDLFVNSSSDYSFMSKDTAKAVKLATKPMSNSFTVGNGKSLAASMGYVDELKFGAQKIGNAHFIVISGEGAPDQPILGQNILDIQDIEFDIANKVIRLSRPQECSGKDMAYWAKPEQVRTVSLETPQDDLHRHTLGRGMINGIPMRIVFTTSVPHMTIAASTLRKLDARYARQEGDTVKLDTVSIGDDELHDVTVAVAPGDHETDLTIGLDFFLTHRVYVANGRKTLFFTANAKSP